MFIVGFVRDRLVPITLFLAASAVCFAQAPSISPGGVVPVYSSSNTIQPGEWVSIYGSNLASGSATWTGNFPTNLGGTTVSIDGKPAYLWFVSPTQINVQAPDDTTSGAVPVVVTTANGTATSTVTLAQFAPSFSLLDKTHVTGIILRSDGSGAYGGGSYDVLGPTGTSLGYSTVAAKPGDNVELFGVGFGPTSPVVSSGQVFSGAASTTSPVSVLIDNTPITPTFAGLSSAGLYQINVTIPEGVGSGDVSLQASVGGVTTQSGVVISVQYASPAVSLPTSFSQLTLGMTFSPTGYAASQIVLDVLPETGLTTYTLSSPQLSFIHCTRSSDGSTFTCSTPGPSVNLLPVGGNTGYYISAISMTVILGAPTFAETNFFQGPITGSIAASISSSPLLTNAQAISGPLSGTYTLAQ